MKKHLSLSFKGLFLLAFTLGCLACGKQYVGMQVNTSGWSEFYQLPVECTQVDQWFLWKYSIEKGSGENEYIVKGTADGSTRGAKSIGNLVLAESRFSLILAHNGTVVDNISLHLRGGDISSPIPFEKKFECQSPFNAAAIFWSATVQG